MKPDILVAAALLGLFTMTPAMAQAGNVCVQNAADTTMFFAAENQAGARATANLAAKATLCLSDGDMGGTVSVFIDENAMEGCSRLVRAGQTEVLLEYSEFDRCRWNSNDG